MRWQTNLYDFDLSENTPEDGVDADTAPSVDQSIAVKGDLVAHATGDSRSTDSQRQQVIGRLHVVAVKMGRRLIAASVRGPSWRVFEAWPRPSTHVQQARVIRTFCRSSCTKLQSCRTPESVTAGFRHDRQSLIVDVGSVRAWTTLHMASVLSAAPGFPASCGGCPE